MLTTRGSSAPGQGAETMGTCPAVLHQAFLFHWVFPTTIQSCHYSSLLKMLSLGWGRLGGSLPSICLPLGHDWGGLSRGSASPSAPPQAHVLILSFK